MAAGVGGGGFFVPLGILLLRFAPKPASGLSQWGSFGASVGGLLLNLGNQHPNAKIRHDPGVVPKEDKEGGVRQLLQKNLTPEQEQDYQDKGGKFYTRPLIHYDMALFLVSGFFSPTEPRATR